MNFCSSQKLPILGVCKGIQLLTVHYRGEVNSVEGHVASHYEIAFKASTLKRLAGINGC
ncbi:MAG: hypothetical protein CMH78_05055 [Nitrospinae bacterium]|nr:hypothetical protein [Nitrospinota bacterium]